MPFISFIMPVRNEEAYIQDAIKSVQKQKFQDWELVIVNDNSSDNTVNIVNEVEMKDGRIHVVQNPGVGQVQAINYGYSKITGKYIKIIDGDDLLAPSFSDNLELLISSEATYHDALLVRDDLKKLYVFRFTSKFKDMDYLTSIRKIMISPPRWSWTISQSIADKIFPLPNNLPTPHEDIYIGLLIKKYAAISYIGKPLYFYRQHAGQYFGGIYNFKKEVVIHRANAMLKILDLIQSGDLVDRISTPDKLLKPVRTYYKLMSKNNISLKETINSELTFKEKIKIIAVKKLPKVASIISVLRSILISKLSVK